ncbi:MAG TPA: MarR family transcriptional regulator [Devosiaceae bacterium]
MKNENQAPISADLMRALRAHQNASDVMDTAVSDLLGINRTDGMCIDIVDQHGRISAGELATALGLSTGAVTTVIDRMEKAGYLRRVPDPDDRRRVLTELTDDARLITGLIFEQMGDLGRALMGKMSEEEQRLVTRFLEVSAAMNQDMAAGLRKHVPKGPADFEERLRRARSFHRDQKRAVEMLQTLLGAESEGE